MAIILKDNFVWLDVTEQMKYGEKRREELWLAHELYAIHDDESESLLESHKDIDEALKRGLRIGIEGGYLPDLETKEKPYEYGEGEELRVGIYSWTDEDTNEKFYDEDSMIEEFEYKLNKLLTNKNQTK